MNKQLFFFVLTFIPSFLFSQQTFINATSSAGINAGNQDYGQASAWCDMDNDGDLDLAFSYDSGSSFKLFQNNDGAFSDITASSGLSGIAASSIIWAEINGDTFSDMFTRNYLYINNGDNTFTNSGTISGAEGINSVCDFNADGNVDILNIYPTVFVMFGNGNGTFTDVYDFSLNNIYASACFDYNADGFMDIIFGTNGSSGNKLFENNGDGTFMDVTAGSGIATSTEEVSGISVGDINNDGFPDIYFALHLGQLSSPGNILYKNNNNGTFTNITTSSGAIGQSTCRTSIFFDYNNDGFLDILVDDHYKGNFLYSNNQDETFTEVAELVDIRDVHPTAGIGGDYFGTSVGDYNNDGAPDIFVTGHWSIYKLYENTNCPNNYITINLTGVESDYNAVGSRIKITCGNFVVYRWITPAESMNDFYALPLNIGIGDNVFIDEIEILWSSGLFQTIENIAANQIIEIIEGENPVNINNRRNEIVKVFPNPFNINSNLIISGLAQNSFLEVKVYKSNGQTVNIIKEESIQRNSISLNINNLEKGTYILKININGEKTVSEKIISY